MFAIFGQKKSFFMLKHSPRLFFGPKSPFIFSFLKYVNFWPLYSIFPGGILGVLLLFFHFLGIFSQIFAQFLEHFCSIFPFLGIFSQIFGPIFGTFLFYFFIFGDIQPNFGPFLEHFCYMLRNGLGNKTCFIPLGIILFFNPLGISFLIPLGIRLYFCQTLTQNGLEIIVLGPF